MLNKIDTVKTLGSFALISGLILFAQLVNAQISAYLPSSIPVSKCTNGSQMSLNVATTGNLVITMPAGISYVPGSVTGATFVSASSNTATFTVAAAGAVTYYHTATCAVDEMLTFTDKASLNGGGLNVSNAYNVAEAAPQVTAVANSPAVANVGQTVIKTVSITNGGFGTVSDWYYQEIMASGEYQIATTGITFGGNPLPVGNVTLTSGGGKDTLTVHFTAAEMVLIGDNDVYFDGNFGGVSPESFNLVYTVIPISCGTGYAVNSSHRIYYGCDAIAPCSDASFASLLDLNIPAPPNLAFTYSGSFPTCFSVAAPISRTLTITNTGGPATNLNVVFGNYYSYHPSYGYASYIDTATFKYRINGGALQRVTFSNLYNNGTTWEGDPLTAGTAGKPSLFTFQIPFVPAGAVVTFAHDFYKSEEGTAACPGGNDESGYQYDEQIYVKNGTTYKNACGDVTYNVGDTYLSYRGYSHSVTLAYPSDMVDNQVENFQSNIISGIESVSEIAVGGYLEVKTTIPNGYTTQGAPTATAGAYTWASTTTQVGNVVTSRFLFPKPAGFDMSFMAYNLPLKFECALRAFSDPSTFYQQHRFVQDPSCSVGRELSCVQNTPLVHCPGCTGDGIYNLSATTFRKNFGKPDANNDGIADAGPYDFSKMALKNAFYKDTVEYTYSGTIHWSASAFSNAYSESVIQNFSSNFSIINADVSVYRAGVLVVSPTPFIPTVSGNIVTTDFSSILSLMLNGDSIVTRMRTKVIDPRLIQGQQEIGFTSINKMYASYIANPVEGPDRKYCDAWGGTINTVSFYYTSDCSGIDVKGCDKTMFYHYTYLSVGVNGTNNYFQKSTRFPYEVRQWAKADTALIILPQSYNYNVDSVQIDYYRTAGLTYVGKTIYSAPFSYSNDSIIVNLQRHYAEFGGPTDNPVSDDGWMVVCRPYISTKCKTTVAASPIGAGWDTKPFNNTAQIPYDLTYYVNGIGADNYKWDVAQQVRFAQSTPVQLVAAGGGVKNVAGRSFTYPNVIISNQTNSPSAFGYVYFTSTVKSRITSVVYGGTTILADANGYYSIGGFSGGQAKTLIVNGLTTSCNNDQINMYYGWDCRAIPTVAPTSATQCYPPLSLLLRPLAAKIDGTVTPLATTPPNPATGTGTFGATSVTMCETFPTEIVVNSALQGTIYDVYVNAKLPAGVTYEPGSAYFETPTGSAPQAVSAAQEAALIAVGAGGVLPFDLQSMSSNNIDSLQGTVAVPSLRKLKIRFLLRPSCTYDGKGRVRATLLANRACGTPAINNGTTKSGNTLKLSSPSGGFAVTLTPTIAPINGCGVLSAGSLTVDKTDTAVPTSSDSITMTVPSGVDITNITCATCSPALGAPNVNDDGTNKTLSWEYPSGNVTGTIVIGFDASANANATCAVPQEISATVTQLKAVYCTAISGNCPGTINIAAADAAANFTINLPTFSITALTANVYTTVAPFAYGIAATINNTSSITASSYKVIYAYDTNGDGAITAADNILGVDNITTALSGGGNAAFNKSFATSVPSGGADFIVGIVPINSDLANGTCACDDAAASVAITTLPSGTVGNYVWSDTNGDGIQDGSEAGINGITVQLYQETAPGSGVYALAQTATTANNGTNDGAYNFLITSSANYYVAFPTANGTAQLSPQTATAGTDGNSDANTTTGNSPVFAINVNGTGIAKDNATIDAGFRPTGTIGNYVWTDSNNNGSNDESASAGINGVTVQLWKETTLSSGVYALVQSALTANDGAGNPGYYNFTVGEAANYKVKFPTTNSGNILATQTTAAATDNNSDADATTGFSPVFAINTNGVGTDKNNPTIDAGFAPTATVGNYVWADANGNGLNDEPTTAGINGVTVQLWRETAPGSGVYAVAQTTTTANDGAGNTGYYNFITTQSGNYYVHFPTSTTASNTLSPQDGTAGTDGNSDADVVTGNSPIFALDVNGTGVAKNNTTIDAAYLAYASLGDRVWLDKNKDGIQDVSEVGVAGITVTLYDNTGKVVAATKTDAYGNYLFSRLTPNDYIVGFSLPSNYVFTAQGTGTDSGTATDSDVNGGTISGTFGLTQIIAISAGEDERNVDAGIYFGEKATASIGDYVWFDTNADGLQDAAEKGIAGVTVTLYNNAGVAVATTITDGTGHYLFDNVVPGTYSVGFAAQPGLVLTAQTNATTDGSDAVPATGKTPTFTVAAAEQRRDIDAGFKPVSDPANSAAVGDYVWNDLNNDGIQGADEAGLVGVTVTLYSADGTTVVATTVTDAFGHYLFNDLTPDAYRIQFTAPTGFVIVAKDAGGDDSKDSDASSTSGMTRVFTLVPGDKNLTIDCGLYNASQPTGSIGDYVWNDSDKDGIQDANESGVGGITVTLTDGTTTWTTTTDVNGKYLFSGLPAGNYTVAFSNIPEGYVFTSQTNATINGSDANSAGVTNTISLAAGERKTDIDAGIFPAGIPSGKASIGNYVWYDTNNDGKQDVTEIEGAAGVIVTLYAANGTTVLAIQRTDATGYYLFTSLDAGSYIVGFAPSSLPAGYAFAPINATGTGFTTDNDSDADATTGKTAAINIAAGEENTSVDAGIWKSNSSLGSIGNFVWNDLNGDGKQDGGELGVTGVSVTLIDKVTGAIVKATTTDKNGAYLFSDLPYGTYNVVFGNLPAGFMFSPKDASSDSIDSDADPITGKTADIVLNAGNQNDNTVDAGIRTNTKAGLGDYVWEDTNGDGVQNTNESGLAGVLVTLLDGAGTLITTVVTDDNGYYTFMNLTPGSYRLTFTNLPEGSLFTKQGQGTTATDNDADATGKTALITLAAGEFNNTIDAGVVLQKAGLGDYVWSDTDGNGVQNATEMGMAGITVSLYDAATNQQLARTVTDGNGFYQFVNLKPATYYVVFEPTTLPANSVFTTQTAGTVNGSDANTTTGRTANITLVAGEYNGDIDAGVIPTAALGDYVWIDTDKNGLQDIGESGLGGVTVNLYRASNPTTVFRTVTTRSSGAYWFTNLPADDYIVEFSAAAGYTHTGVMNGTEDGSDADLVSGRTGVVTLTAGQKNPNIDAGYYVTPLPVTLLYFKGKGAHCTTVLDWSTASEQNAKLFTIERSSDGKTWSSIGKVAAAGNSTTVQTYQFTDAKPARNTYYRLVQTDFDGVATTYPLSQSVTAKGCYDKMNGSIAKLYPNPNKTNELNIEFQTEGSNEVMTIQIYDVLGQLLTQHQVSITNDVSNATIDITDLAAGTYIVKIVGSNNQNTTQKLVRVR